MSSKIKKILVPVDFSEVSLEAVDYAAQVAEKVGAQIKLLHVVESYSYNVAMGEDESTDVIAKGIDQKMKEIKKRDSLKDVKVEAEQKDGKIYQVIHDLAEKEETDLVVMGTHGATGLSDVRKFVLGTNAYRVVLSVPCPVITISGNQTVNFDNILLPLDITKTTQQKVGIAIEWAKLFDATIHVVSVSRFIDEFVVSVEKLRLQLRRAAERIKEEGVDCTTHMIRHSNIADSVLDYADEVDAGLIMIMTLQERKWNEFILGSNARTIVSKAKRPVMSIRPSAEE
jgi:nucleotide-binding universal stress UspA family protein